jgi:hypothetical protein
MGVIYKLLAITLLITRAIIIYDNIQKIKENKKRKGIAYDDTHTRF